MRYLVFDLACLHHQPATVWTRDSVVTHATPAYAWAVGKKIEVLLDWSRAHGRRWMISGMETKPVEGYKTPNGGYAQMYKQPHL